MVAAHLEDCDRCGVEADLFEQVKERLSTLHQQPDPAAIDGLRRFADQVPSSPPEEFRA